MSDIEAKEAVKSLLLHIGEDPERDGLIDTPKRVVKALTELTSGYNADIGKLLAVSFDVACDSMVMVRDIKFHSLCEHHMLPFHGTATVAYIPRPSGGVVGLSKMARLVDAFARRLQVQERMTNQVADALVEHLQPLGAGVIIRGYHSCMSSRGIQREGEMVTCALRGVLHDEPEARAEFLHLAEAR